MIQSSQILEQKMTALGRGVPLDGDPLALELELSCQLGVNRTTIGAMLRALKRDNLIQTEPGCGTFLNCRCVEKDLGGLVDFQIEDTAAGHLQHTLVLPRSELLAACQEAAVFQLQQIGRLTDAGVVEISANLTPCDYCRFRGNRKAASVRR